MSGPDIAAEVAQALEEAATEVGIGPLVVTLWRVMDDSPTTYPPAAPVCVEFEATAIISENTSTRADDGVTRTGTVQIMVSSSGSPGIYPQVGDILQVTSSVFPYYIRQFVVQGVDTVNPGGVVLMWTVTALERDNA